MKTFLKKYKILLIFSCFILFIAILFYNYFKKEAYFDKKQLDLISFKVEKKSGLFSDESKFVIKVYNGSDMEMKNVSLMSTENIVKIDETLVEESQKLRGLYLGTIKPFDEVYKNIEIKNNSLNLGGFFEIEFKDTTGVWWFKKENGIFEEKKY